MKPKFVVGQKWSSQAEPELGVGRVSDVRANKVTVKFSKSDAERTYSATYAPLHRILKNVGDIVQVEGHSRKITKVLGGEAVASYELDGEELVEETLLPEETASDDAVDRFLALEAGDRRAFELRNRMSRAVEQIDSSGLEGYLGGRIELLPHQFHVARKIIEMEHPRAILADEVGLGKTIEACIVLHHALISGRYSNALIIVPKSLTHQWMIELFRKFNLGVKLISEESFIEEDSEASSDGITLVSLELLTQIESYREMLLSKAWDLVIVDEAHRLKWNEGESNDEYKIVEILADVSKSLILLTANSEAAGNINHFGRLRLVDPERFGDFEKYKSESKRYSALSKELGKVISSKGKPKFNGEVGRVWDQMEEQPLHQKLEAIMDLFGTGRSYFRNTRHQLEQRSYQFPKRVLNKIEVKDEDGKFEWLIKTLESNPDKKFLLICKKKELVQELEEKIRIRTTVAATTFHSDLKLVVRDRHAAYFAESGGARILLCSEIGSEGRNFQFVSDLILYDLPANPEVLEQRLGRLDRIGQKSDISIHVPVNEDDQDQTVFQIMNEGFQIFSQPYYPVDLPEKVEKIKSDLIKNAYEYSASDQKKIQSGVLDIATAYQKAIETSRSGRDILLEINSCFDESTSTFLESLRKEDQSNEHHELLMGVLDRFGVHIEDLEPGVYLAAPTDHMLIEHFPGLEDKGLKFSFDRNLAVVREDLHFVSIDHPLFLGAIDSVLSTSFGSVAFAKNKESESPEGFRLEVVFAAKFVRPSELWLEKFSVRRWIHVSSDWVRGDLNPSSDRKLDSIKLTGHELEMLAKIPRDVFRGVISYAKKRAKRELVNLQKEVEQGIQNFFDHEMNRRSFLAKVSDIEVDQTVMKQQLERSLEAVSTAELSVDSISCTLF